MAREAQTEAEFELMRQQMGYAPEQDARLLAKFSMEPVELSETTKEERIKAGQMPPDALGRPVYEEQEFITIYIPGDKDNVIFRPIRNVDKVRFAAQYRAFRDNKSQPDVGTPLSSLPFMSKSQVLELEYFGCKTAEQLVGMSDVNGQKVIGWSQLKKRVQTFLDAAAGAAPALKLQSELEKRDADIDTLRKQLEAQSKIIEGLQRKPAKE